MADTTVDTTSLLRAAAAGDDAALRTLLHDVLAARPETLRGLVDATDRRIWERILRAGAEAWHAHRGANDAGAAGTDWLATATQTAFATGGQCTAELVRRETLLAGLQDASPAVRAGAVDLLGRRGDASLLREMELLAADPNDHVRAAAIRAISRLTTERALPVLLRAIQRFDIAAKEAVAGLQRLGPAAVPPLLHELQYGNRWTRWHAAKALGGITDERAIDPLVAALTDEDASVRWEAMAALSSVGALVLIPLCGALERTTVSPWLAEGADRLLRRVAHGRLWSTVAPLHDALHHVDAAVEVPVQAFRVKQALQAQASAAKHSG